MSRCLPGGKIGYDRIAEGQGFSGPAGSNYTIDNDTSYQDTVRDVKMDTVADYSASNSAQAGSALPSINQQSDQPSSIAGPGAYSMNFSASIFSACFPGKYGLTANAIALVIFCAAQVGSSMAIGSLVLLTDFFRRLSCVFLLIYDMEAVQLEEDLGGSSTDIHGTAHRGHMLAKAMVGVYVLASSFFMATFALWRMYGHDPPSLDDPGWLILFGCLGLASDVLHVFCGVNQTLIHDDIELSRFLWCFLQVYGSLFVLMEGLIASMSGGRYLDPIMTIIFTAVMTIGNVGPVLAASAELYNRVRA